MNSRDAAIACVSAYVKAALANELTAEDWCRAWCFDFACDNLAKSLRDVEIPDWQ